MSEISAEPSGLDRRQVISLALGAIALTALLMVAALPLRPARARDPQQRVERETGARSRSRPGRRSRSVRLAPGIAATTDPDRAADGTRSISDRLGVRPALALAWLRGRPALATEIESARGGASGVVTFGAEPGFSGTLTNLDLEQLPQQRLGAPLHLTGRADADLDVVMREAGPDGDVEFEARDGLLTHPNIPMPVPFQKLVGEIALGGDAWADIRKFELTSPLATGHATGSVGRSPQFASAPLRLEIEVSVSSAVQGSLRSQGVAIGNDGQIHVNVAGTPARPVVR
jgi:hypothetical protein